MDIRRIATAKLMDMVSFVFQDTFLFYDTLYENITVGSPVATKEKVIAAAKAAQCHDFIEKMPDKYNTYIEQGGSNVSGGQKQRICIARALLKKPKILILDDSTSAVDTKTDALIRKAFREEIPDTTKFIIAQRISTTKEADKILVLQDGHITEAGSHEELLAKKGYYYELVRLQTGIDDAVVENSANEE